MQSNQNLGDEITDKGELAEIKKRVLSSSRNSFGKKITNPDELEEIKNFGKMKPSNAGSYPEAFMQGLGTGASNMGENVGNNLSALLNHIAGAGASNKLKSYMPEMGNQSYDPFTGSQAKDVNGTLASMLGMGDRLKNAAAQNPLTEKMGEVTSQAAPFMMAPELAGMSKANWLTRAALQADVGGVTSKDPREGALVGAGAELLNPAFQLLGKGVGKALPANLHQKAKDLWDVATTSIGHLSDKVISDREGLLHTKALKEADDASQNIKYKFDNSHYKNELENYRDKIKADHLSTHPDSPEWNGAVKMLNQWINSAPDDLYGMVKTNKSLNKIFGGQIKPGVQIPSELPAFAIKSIKETLAKNLEKNGLTDTLGKSIQEANNFTKERVKHQHFDRALTEDQIVNTFRGMDTHTQKNLFSDDDVKKIVAYEKATGKNKRVYNPPHLSDWTDYAKAGLRRAPGGAAVGISNQPISFDSDNQ